jgi:phosphatidylserine decarboxylase
VFLGFTFCPDVCPTTLAELAGAQNQWEALPDSLRPRVLFISVDPDRDSATRLGEYVHGFHKDTLAATADVPSLERFATSLGFVFQKVPGKHFDENPEDYTVEHSASLAVLDPQGRLAGLVRPVQRAGDCPRPAEADRENRPMSLTTALTRALPHRLLSSMARSLAYSDDPRVSRWLIDTVTRKFNVDLDEAANPTRAATTFNQFFTRALKPGAWPMPIRARGDAGRRPHQPARQIEAGRIFQAKGQSFTAAELLGDEDAAVRDGLFATVYLSPRDYHRVHMPLDRHLRETVHARTPVQRRPGGQRVPRLFARNERLVCHFDTSFGPMVSDGRCAAGVRRGNRVERRRSRLRTHHPQGLPRPGHQLERFAEMALQLRLDRDRAAAAGRGRIRPQLGAESPVQLGQAGAKLR